MDNNTVIRALTIYGNSLKKLRKFLPEGCIKSDPYKKSDLLKYKLEININGVIFTGEGANSSIAINNFDRNYTREELIAFQKIAIKCYTYPFGDLGFSFELNIFSNDKTEKTIETVLNKYKIEHSSESLDSKGHIKLSICDVKDYARPSFIDFVLELQSLTLLLNEEYDAHYHM